jgi:O-methyltransferase domain/Dimerisation domain
MQPVAPAAQPSTPAAQAPPPVQMVQMLAGFQVSQALYVAAKLDLGKVLRAGPRSPAELAAETGADAGSLRRIMRTLASVGLYAEVEPEVYATTALGDTLASGAPGSVRDLAITWMETHYAPFARLLDGVRSGECAATLHYGRPFFQWLSGDGEQMARFTGAMADLTNGIKVHALDGYRLPDGELTCDVGGADGSVLAAILVADPDTTRRGIVFDLPGVVPAAHERLAAMGLAERVSTVGGDFFEAVPTADIYLLSMVLHDWDDVQARRLLSSIAASARPGARVVALELMLPEGGEPHMAKMIDLTMLGMLTGRERTMLEHADLLHSAGFRVDSVRDTATPMTIIEATLL